MYPSFIVHVWKIKALLNILYRYSIDCWATQDEGIVAQLIADEEEGGGCKGCGE